MQFVTLCRAVEITNTMKSIAIVHESAENDIAIPISPQRARTHGTSWQTLGQTCSTGDPDSTVFN